MIYLDILVNVKIFGFHKSCFVDPMIPVRNHTPLCSIATWLPSASAESMFLFDVTQNIRLVCVPLKAVSQVSLSVPVTGNCMGIILMSSESSVQPPTVPGIRGISMFSAKSFWGMQMGRICLLNLIPSSSLSIATLLSPVSFEYFV